jgi:hypothetical protein
MTIVKSALIAHVAACLGASAAQATEGALGRPISGTGVQENAGLVPPVPIWAVALGSVYQDASIGAGRQVPIAGQISLGIHSDLSLTTATLAKVWDTGPGAWNFESTITLPYDWNKITAQFMGPLNTFSTTDSVSNLFDIFFAPVTAGYHISKTEHVSLSLGIWTQSGEYDVNRLANPSLNNWTFVPSASYTKIIPEHGLEFDASLGLQFYTRNTATDYQNAPLLTLDMMLLKKFPNGLALGIITGWVQQLGSDTGPTADKLNGFEGHDISVGPYVSYSTKLGGKAPLSFSLRWVPTVESKNRISGDTVLGVVELIL